jgi:hypothetical protein
MWAEERDELDRILNQALFAYPAEPLLGIEARLLRRVRNEGRATQRTSLASTFWSRALGAGLAVALVAAGVFLSRSGLVKKTANPNPTAAARPVNSVKAAAETTPPEAGTRENQEIEGTIRGAVRRSALPKLDVFPTPSPLTPEELALARMTKAALPAATARQESAVPVQLEPIQIQVLEIKPLAADADEDGDK